MIYLHGGGFVGGSGAGIDGTQFAKQGVVLVTRNYRLGRAGWFAHPALTHENPTGPLGNYGLDGSDRRAQMGAATTSQRSAATRTT